MGVVFIIAGAHKLMAPASFALLIEAYGLLPDTLSMTAAVVLSVLELAAGIGLLLDLRGSLGAITSMLVLFIAILSYGIYMGLDIDCGCFGPADPESEVFHGLRTALYRDLVMMVCAGLLYYHRARHRIEPERIKFPWTG